MAIDNLSSLIPNKEEYPAITTPERPEYYLSAEEYNKLLSTLQLFINDYNINVGNLSTGLILPLLTSGDAVTTPTDSNLFTAARTLQEITEVLNQQNKNYLSSLNDDVAEGKITFNKGVEFGDYQEGFKGGYINQYADAELKSLKIKEWLEVPEFRYNRVEIQMGDKWRSPGGGIIESVDLGAQTVTLKLEPGEYGAVAVNDLCMGIFHSIIPSNNSNSDTDDSKNNRTIKGFATAYFKVVELLNPQGNNNEFRYELRPLSSRHTKQISPEEFMNFAVFGNTTNTNRQTSAYETRTYQRFLINMNDWEISQLNVAAQFGDLSNLNSLGLTGLTGYSVYLNNVYFTGTLQQIRAPKIEFGTWWTWDGEKWVDSGVPATGEGKDGDTYEYIFKQTSTLYPPDPDPQSLDAVQENDFVPSPDNGYPTFIGWTDNNLGIDVINQYEWRSRRERIEGVWSKFGEAKLVSRWGQNGLDGDTYEYIFKRTEELISPSPSPKQLPAIQEPDFVPSADKGYPEFEGWTDNFVGPTKVLPYSWICKRKRVNEVWETFTNPEIWSTYSIDGNSTETVYKNTTEMIAPSISQEAIQTENFIPEGWTKNPTNISESLRFQWESKRERLNEVWSIFYPPALHGVYGEDGTDIEFIYNNTETDNPPDIIYSEPDFQNRNIQDDEYLPRDGGTGTGWKDNAVDITKSKPYLWITKRKKINGSWEDFTTPKKLSVHGRDGTEIEYVFYLTDKEVAPTLIQNTESESFQNPEYLPKDENNINWLDERVSVSSDMPYLWISTRKKKDGVWQAFYNPTIETVYPKNGADGAMVEYWGDFDPTVTYLGYPTKIIAVKHGDNYYKTKTSAGEFLGGDYTPQSPAPANNPNYPWEPFGNTFRAVATDLLLAPEANIANFWFKNQRMESRPNGKDSAELAMYLDGYTGEVMFSNGNVLLRRNGSGYLAGGKISWDVAGIASFTGKLIATSGTIGGFEIGVNILSGTDTQSAVKLSPNYFFVNGTVGNTVSELSISTDVIPATLGLPLSAMQSIDVNVITSGFGRGTIGTYYNVRGQDAVVTDARSGSHAIFIENGSITGVRFKTRRLTNSTNTLTKYDTNILVKADNITIWLPDDPEDGQMYWINPMNRSNININSYQDIWGVNLNGVRTHSISSYAWHIFIYDKIYKLWAVSWTG